MSSGEAAGNPIKHRLDFRGNRRINSVLYIASVTQQRSQPEAAAYLARKATEVRQLAPQSSVSSTQTAYW